NSNAGSGSGTKGCRAAAVRGGAPSVARRRPDRRFFGGRAAASGCVGMARNYNRCMNDQSPPALHAPGPDIAPRPESAGGPNQQASFVAWLRTVAPYIHAFRGRTFVIGIAGELIAEGRLTALVNDISLLNAMGMRIVLVHGSRPQVVEQLRLRGLEGRYRGQIRITDEIALECVKEASGELRLDIEAAFSQGLPNTPMAH